MIDIDHFKLYNDHYGHQAGDECLHRVAQVIQAGLRRAGDLAARYGGEEFLLVLPNTDAEDAGYLAEAIRQSVEELNLPHASSPLARLTISVGVAAMFDGIYTSSAALLRAADEALYLAKQGGRNQVQLALAARHQNDLAMSGPGKLVQLVWHKDYETGNSVIDGQHRAMFNDANKLLDMILAASDASEIAAWVDTLVADMAEHFREEEATFYAAGYPDADRHARLHRALLAKANQLAARSRADQLVLGDLFVYLTQEMVKRHILTADREFIAFLKPSR